MVWGDGGREAPSYPIRNSLQARRFGFQPEDLMNGGNSGSPND